MKAAIAITIVIIAFVAGKYHRSRTAEIGELNRRIHYLADSLERAEQRTDFWGLKSDHWYSNYIHCLTNSTRPTTIFTP